MLIYGHEESLGILVKFNNFCNGRSLLGRHITNPLDFVVQIWLYIFFEKDVKPYLNDKIQWVGDVSAKQTAPVAKIVELYQNAKAFLMTINQHENFGLVMIEAMSCGTPVIGFDRGSVPEVIVNGKTGFVVPYEEGVEGFQKALSQIHKIKPEDCRNHVLENFSIEKMVGNYEKLYLELIKK